MTTPRHHLKANSPHLSKELATALQTPLKRVKRGYICRDQSSILKFRLTPVYLSKDIKIDLRQELNLATKKSWEQIQSQREKVQKCTEKQKCE
jgi:hypothetical protein